MAATLTETLMALGDFSLELDYDEDLVVELEFFRHVLVYWGEQPIFTGVLLRRRIGKDMVAIGGRSLEWWLGLDDDGPLIEDREYLACTNKLSNPGFEFGDLYWRLGEGSMWAIRELAGEPHAGTWAAAATGDFGKDDRLSSEERFEVTPGDEFSASVRAHRPTGSVGQLRLRTVYEGRFDPPNLVTNGGFVTSAGWTNTSEVSGDAAIESGHLRIGPTTRLQRIKNPSFEDGLANWEQFTGSWFTTSAVTPVDGTDVAGTAAGGPSQKTLIVDDDPGINQSILVTPGERYLLDGWIRPNPGADGTARIYTYVGDVTFPLNATWIYLEEVDNTGGGGTDWRYCHKEFDIPESKIALVPMCEVLGHTTGFDWYFDRVQLTRVKGNKASYRYTTFAVTPERTYRVLAQVTPDAEMLEGGTLRASVLLTAAGRPPVTLESPVLERGDATQQLLSWDFTPPSGYTTAALSLVGIDVIGGSFIVDNLSVVDQDTSTWISDDVLAAAPVFTVLAQATIAPSGAERVYLELLVESEGAGWVVDTVVLKRIGTPAIAADVVRDLLIDPVTGSQLIGEGSVDGSDTLIYDWHIRNLTNRQALQHLSRSGVCSPTREYRVNPDNTLDWGEAADLFEDRTDIVLSEADLVVIGLPEVEENAETRLTRVKVIGAERQLPNGARVLITGEALNDPGDAEDWFGAELSRTRVIEDSTVDHRDYAGALASYDAERNSDRQQTVQMQMSDWRALGRFNVGDWIYVYKPESGIEDLTNPVGAIYPQRQRVPSRTWNLGPGPFRIEIRKSDGTTIDVTESVRWEPTTTAQIEVGDLLPEFVADPQGGAAGVQFRRFRASRSL